jgi:TATA-binding protein-associated factor Taf7
MTDEELEEWKAHRKLVGDSLRNLEQSFEQKKSSQE